jgi:hypothetical protein
MTPYIEDDDTSGASLSKRHIRNTSVGLINRFSNFAVFPAPVVAHSLRR